MVGRREGYTPEVIASVQAALEALPAGARPKSKAKAVAELIGEIKAARALGYSIAEIADLMAANGLPIKPSTLKGYVSVAGSKPDNAEPKKAGGARVASGKVRPAKAPVVVKPELKPRQEPPDRDINKSAATASIPEPHTPRQRGRRTPPNPFLEADRKDR